MVNKNVVSCLLKDGKEVNAVMLVGRLFHARATVTAFGAHYAKVVEDTQILSRSEMLPKESSFQRYMVIW